MIGKERERRRKSEKKKKEQKGTGKARNTQLKIIGFYRSGSKVPLGARDIRQRQGQSIESEHVRHVRLRQYSSCSVCKITRNLDSLDVFV